MFAEGNTPDTAKAMLGLGPSSGTASAKAAPGWIELAQKRAREIIKDNQNRDLYPSQENIADQIAREFRADGVVGADGKPLTGATIKRHALKGISSARSRQLSTANPRGK
jgi:hypothetical protein